MQQVAKKTINKELCENDIGHALFHSRCTFVQKYLPGIQHTVLEVKIYIDMTGIGNSAPFLQPIYWVSHKYHC